MPKAGRLCAAALVARAILVERSRRERRLDRVVTREMWSIGRLASKVRDASDSRIKFSDYFDFADRAKVPPHAFWRCSAPKGRELMSRLSRRIRRRQPLSELVPGSCAASGRDRGVPPTNIDGHRAPGLAHQDPGPPASICGCGCGMRPRRNRSGCSPPICATSRSPPRRRLRHHGPRSRLPYRRRSRGVDARRWSRPGDLSSHEPQRWDEALAILGKLAKCIRSN